MPDAVDECAGDIPGSGALALGENGADLVKGRATEQIGESGKGSVWFGVHGVQNGGGQKQMSDLVIIGLA